MTLEEQYERDFVGVCEEPSGEFFKSAAFQLALEKFVREYYADSEEMG